MTVEAVHNIQVMLSQFHCSCIESPCYTGINCMTIRGEHHVALIREDKPSQLMLGDVLGEDVRIIYKLPHSV